MGRWGLSELQKPGAEVVGLMTHLATAESDPDYAAKQIELFRTVTEQYSDLMRHAANSAAALRLPTSRFDVARCGIALYGLSPFGEEPVGAPVTILGPGVLAEEHARVAGTINYELVCGIGADPRRARRVVVDA